MEGTKQLLHSLNKAAKEAELPEGALNEAFTMWWPRLEKTLQDIISAPPVAPTKPKRENRELLEEILETVRRLDRQAARTESESTLLIDPRARTLSEISRLLRPTASAVEANEATREYAEELAKRMWDRFHALESEPEGQEAG